ncbi:hypothetical protein VE02_06490 [Pseudogymnoascus sp. 03VT05]|nr:hypothetical protein VE02_06490 [Pseudogymnoascus sp. 03VT05]
MLATPIEVQEDYIYVQANDYTSVSWETEVKSCAAKEESAFYDAIEITLDEVIEDRSSAQKGPKPYIIVGIAYYKDSTLHHKAHKELSKKGTVGDVANQLLVTISRARKLWVVAPMIQAAPINVQYFVLLHREDNFRKPYPIQTKDVFFVHYFRTAATALKSRIKEWNGKVCEVSVADGLDAGVDATEAGVDLRNKVKATKNTTKVLIQQDKAVTNELLMLMTCYKQLREEWYVHEMIQVLKRGDEDLKHAPAAEMGAIRLFLDVTETFTEDDACDFVAQFMAVWPVQATLTTEDIMRIRKELEKEEIFVKYRVVRPFILEASFSLSQESKQDAVAKIALETVHRGLKEILSAVLTALKGAVAAAKKFNAQAKDAYGD